MLRTVVILLPLVLAACAGPEAIAPSGERHYLYVDEQGRPVQVTVAAAASESPAVEAASPREGMAEVELSLSGAPEGYQSDEDVQARLRALENDRFIVYQDASGYRVVQPVRLVDEKEALEKARQEQHQSLATPEFMDRMEPFTADCCVHALRARQQLRPNLEQLLTFREQRLGWIDHTHRHPAYAFRLDKGLAALKVQSFIRKQEYLHPHVLVLNGEGVPLLYIDNLFDRRYPEKWYRHGYLEGEFLLPPDAEVVVFYLPYERVTRLAADGIGVAASEPLEGFYPWQVSGLKVSTTLGEVLIKGLPPAP